MHEPTDDFLNKTRGFWQSRTDRQLTTEDARQIVENVSGFLQTVIRWHLDEGDEPGAAGSHGNVNSAGTSATRNGRGQKKKPHKRQSAGPGEPLTPVLVAGNQTYAEET
jgi:hypothetical protein